MNISPKNFTRLVFTDEIVRATLTTDPVITGVIDDSNQVKPGSLFFAVTGTKTDGHQFIAKAFDAGAAAVVIEKAEFLSFPKTVLVENSRAALAKASCRWFKNPTQSFSLVGITGTNGKTTTAYLCKQVWDTLGFASGMIGTVQNFIGRGIIPSQLTTPGPLALQSLFAEMRQAQVSRVAMEVSSIALDQKRTLGSEFKAAIFTNLTQDHLDYHQNFENYYAAKKRLFTEYGSLIAVVNVDDHWGRRLVSELASPVTYSVSENRADYRFCDVTIERGGMAATLLSPVGTFTFKTPLLGRHNLYNVLGVIATMHTALKISMPDILRALTSATGAPGRLQLVTSGAQQPSVFVDYAHTTDALRNVLVTLTEVGQVFSGNLITVFGCGGDRDKTKRPQMGEVASHFSDVTLLTSDNPRSENPEAILDDIERGVNKSATHFLRQVDRRTAIRQALQMAKPSDIVLIAGKGHENYQILNHAKVDFDDAQEVRNFFAAPI